MKEKVKAYLEKEAGRGKSRLVLGAGMLGYALGTAVPSYIINKKTKKLAEEVAKSDKHAVKEVLKGLLGGAAGVTGGLVAYKKGKSLDKKSSSFLPEAMMTAGGIGGVLGLASGALDGYQFSKLKKQIIKENKTIAAGAKKIKNMGYLTGLGSLGAGLAYYKGKSDSKKDKSDSKKGKND